MTINRRYLVLHGLRWLPTGLLIPILALLPLQRGLSLGQIGLVFATQGLVVLFLELPTGGLADALGRRPVLLLASATGLAALILLFFADSMALFAGAYFLQGIYRALDSGPLESWYVDAALDADRDADIEAGLSRGSLVLGLAIAAGALLSGGLIALDPLPGVDALAVPVLTALVLQAVYFAALAVLLIERRPARGLGALTRSIRAVPSVIASGASLLRRSRILLALVAVELFWGFGMVTYETLLPVRLSEVVGGGAAAAIMGPAGSAAWLVSALGAGLVPRASRRFGVPLTAAALRILQGTTVVGMALLAGPAGVLAAYLACYTIHGAANPLHQALLHRQVDGPYRTTVLSMNSMIAQPAGALGGVALGALADATTVPVAMLVGAVVLAAAAPLYLPARATARPAAAGPVPAGSRGAARSSRPGGGRPSDAVSQVGTRTASVTVSD
ncbi:MAG: MFS transporter [Micromonosporaceae bacterium]|nr:MFS transporter [Micromonosporaceae bacterium]